MQSVTSIPHLNQNESFVFRRRVSFYETDAMAVVHHSNFVRYLEDARVEWMRHSGLLAHHAPEGKFVFAVRELGVNYIRPLKFDDQIDIWMQVKLDGIRIRIQYAIERVATVGDVDGAGEARVLAATGHTVLIPLDSSFTPKRLPLEARMVFDGLSWSESFPR